MATIWFLFRKIILEGVYLLYIVEHVFFLFYSEFPNIGMISFTECTTYSSTGTLP